MARQKKVKNEIKTQEVKLDTKTVYLMNNDIELAVTITNGVAEPRLVLPKNITMETLSDLAGMICDIEDLVISYMPHNDEDKSALCDEEECCVGPCYVG